MAEGGHGGLSPSRRGTRTGMTMIRRGRGRSMFEAEWPMKEIKDRSGLIKMRTGRLISLIHQLPFWKEFGLVIGRRVIEREREDSCELMNIYIAFHTNIMS